MGLASPFVTLPPPVAHIPDDGLSALVDLYTLDTDDLLRLGAVILPH
jgi:hypothetical protein